MHTASHTTYLKLSGYVAATAAIAPASDDHLWETPIFGVPTSSLRPKVLLMQVVGNSMDDGTPRSIPHGALVLVDTQDLEFHQMRRGYTYMFVTPDGATVAKVYDLHQGRYVLKSLNPAHPPIKDFRRAGYQPVGLVYGVRESETRVRYLSS